MVLSLQQLWKLLQGGRLCFSFRRNWKGRPKVDIRHWMRLTQDHCRLSVWGSLTQILRSWNSVFIFQNWGQWYLICKVAHGGIVCALPWIIINMLSAQIRYYIYLYRLFSKLWTQHGNPFSFIILLLLPCRVWIELYSFIPLKAKLVDIILAQWFSTGRHMTMSRDIFGCHSTKEVLLASSRQRPGRLLKHPTQNTAPHPPLPATKNCPASTVP